MLASGWVNVLVKLPSKPPGFAASEDEVDWTIWGSYNLLVKESPSY